MPRIEFDFHVPELRALDRLLKQLPHELGYKVRYEALKSAGKPIVRTAKQLAPVGETRVVSRQGRDEVIPGGTLRRSIGIRKQRRRTHGAEVAVFAAARHAHLVEFGTGERVVKKTGRRVGAMPPHPFFRPAVLAHREDFFLNLGLALGYHLERAAQRLAKKASQGKLSKSELGALTR